VFKETEIFSIANNDVIQEWNLQEIAGQTKSPSQGNVGPARARIAARMIVGDYYTVSRIRDRNPENFAGMNDCFVK
jgi:hypothetical protein